MVTAEYLVCSHFACFLMLSNSEETIPRTPFKISDLGKCGILLHQTVIHVRIFIIGFHWVRFQIISTEHLQPLFQFKHSLWTSTIERQHIRTQKMKKEVTFSAPKIPLALQDCPHTPSIQHHRTLLQNDSPAAWHREVCNRHQNGSTKHPLYMQVRLVMTLNLHC